MSTASALLNMIAPAAPTTPQGSATADASVFEGLLSAVVGTGTQGEGGGADAAPILDVDIANDTAGLEIAVSVPGLPAAVQPLLQITGAALSTLASEAVHAPITVALNAQPAEDEAVAEAAPEVAPEAAVATPAPVAAKPAADLAPAPVEDAEAVETVAVEAAPILAVAPLVQPVLPTPVAETSASAGEAVAETPPPVAPRPATPAASPVDETVAEAPADTTPQVRPALADKPVAGSTDDLGPQVRPAVKAQPVDDAQVQPLAPTDTTAKTSTAQPLTRPAEPVAEELTREQAPTDAIRDPRPAVAAPQGQSQVQQTAAPVNDMVAPVQAEPAVATLTPAPTSTSTPDLTAKASAFVPLTQPPVAPDAAVKSAPVAEGRPQTQPPVPVEVVADTAAKAAVAEPLTTPQEPVAADAVAPSIPEADGKPVETPRAAETPNLRALAERASRPLETNAAVDTSAPATPVTTTPQATASAAPTVAAAAPRPAAEAVAEVADASTSVDPDVPVEGVAPEAAPSAQTAHAARETLTPTLSRATIEATAQIAAQILKKLDGRSTRFEMALTPDDLGRVDVKLEIDAEGRLAARLAFDNPAAAADLKGRADELRRQLEQQGFQLADDAFDFTQRDSGSSAFDRGQDSRQGQSRAFAAASRLHTEADIVAQPAGWTALSLTPAGVDMKV